jgi:hypothetical protein
MLAACSPTIRQQVTTNLQDVRRLRLGLAPWRDTQAVRELDEQLAAVGGARGGRQPQQRT